jgi:hypothetical protein
LRIADVFPLAITGVFGVWSVSGCLGARASVYGPAVAAGGLWVPAVRLFA